MTVKCDLCGKDFELTVPDGINIPEPLVCDECKPIIEELSNGKGDDENE